MNAFEQNTTVDHATAKLVTAAGATIFGMSISDAAALAALLYTSLLIGEFIWKKFLRPFAERQGWVKPLRRRASDRINREG